MQKVVRPTRWSTIRSRLHHITETVSLGQNRVFPGANGTVHPVICGLTDWSKVCEAISESSIIRKCFFQSHTQLLQILIPYTRVNKRNWLRSAYCLLSAYFFPGFAPG